MASWAVQPSLPLFTSVLSRLGVRTVTVVNNMAKLVGSSAMATPTITSHGLYEYPPETSPVLLGFGLATGCPLWGISAPPVRSASSRGRVRVGGWYWAVRCFGYAAPLHGRRSACPGTHGQVGPNTPLIRYYMVGHGAVQPNLSPRTGGTFRCPVWFRFTDPADRPAGVSACRPWRFRLASGCPHGETMPAGCWHEPRPAG